MFSLTVLLNLMVVQVAGNFAFDIINTTQRKKKRDRETCKTAQLTKMMMMMIIIIPIDLIRKFLIPQITHN